MLFPLLNGCSVNYGHVLKGNHHIVNEKIDIADYDAILLSLSAEVIYQQISEEEPFLQVSIDENLLPEIDVSVQNKRLIITQKGNINLHPSRFVIYTNSRSLSRVAITGSGDVLLEKAVNAKSMEVSITGSGDIKTDSLYCEQLSVKITGSGDADLKGAANEAQYTLTGSGDINAFRCLVERLTCRISGSGDIEAYVDKQLIARVSGSGDIRYLGNPESVDRKVSGSGSISRVEGD